MQFVNYMSRYDPEYVSEYMSEYMSNYASRYDLDNPNDVTDGGYLPPNIPELAQQQSDFMKFLEQTVISDVKNANVKTAGVKTATNASSARR
jgi:hypothetical protein